MLHTSMRSVIDFYIYKSVLKRKNVWDIWNLHMKSEGVILGKYSRLPFHFVLLL